jgi:hypothetical protein
MPLKASISSIKIVSVSEIDSWYTLYELKHYKVLAYLRSMKCRGTYNTFSGQQQQYR